MSSCAAGGSALVLLKPSEFLEALGYLPFPNALEPYIAALMLETFLYGLYSVLFSICIYILIRRRQFVHWILAVLATVMFSLSTADICYSIFLHFGRALKGTLTFQDMKPKYWFFVINNVLADSTILYRCYVVWGGDLRIMALPVLLFIASMACGFMFEGSSSILIVYSKGWMYIVLTFTLNVILTGLTAGRIWWLSWRGNRILDRDSRMSYHVALAAVIESGLLTALYMIPEFIITSIILDNSIVQVIGIVPTLIVVQVGLGRAVTPVEAPSERSMEPMEAAKRTFKSHVISFFSNKQTATVESKGDVSGRFLSSGVLADPAQLRTGESRITIEENDGIVEKKDPNVI